MNKKAILLGFFLLFFTGCFQGSRELELPKSEHIYINAIASASSTEIKVEAGVTKPIIGTSAGNEMEIQMRAFHNNQQAKVENDEKGFVIELDRGLNIGDKVVLTATSEHFPPVIAEANVLEVPKLLDARGEWVPSDDGKKRVQVELSLEPADKVNYYRLVVRSNWHSESLGMPREELQEREIITVGHPLFPQPKDQLFSETGNAPFALFSLQNKSNITFSYYDVKLENSEDDIFPLNWKYTAEVELQRISKDYYLYLLNCMESANNNAFENPVKIHSNITGGFGIFEIYSPSKIDISMPE